jgi:hypothetical protein
MEASAAAASNPELLPDDPPDDEDERSEVSETSFPPSASPIWVDSVVPVELSKHFLLSTFGRR